MEADDGAHQGYVAAVAVRLATALFALMERIVDGTTDVADDDVFTV
jgi:hypothetical protein